MGKLMEQNRSKSGNAKGSIQANPEPSPPGKV